MPDPVQPDGEIMDTDRTTYKGFTVIHTYGWRKVEGPYLCGEGDEQ